MKYFTFTLILVIHLKIVCDGKSEIFPKNLVKKIILENWIVEMQRVLARRLLGLVPENKTGLERLIDKKRNSYELQVDLDQKKQQHAIKMAQFKAKAEELERKNLENQEEVVSKDQYVCDNWNKRQREEERLMSEEKLLQTKQQELAHLVEEHNKLMEQKGEIEEQLKASLPYKDYLDSVFEAAPEMVSNGNINEVQGIVMKYKTLTEWRGTLQVRLMRSKQELTKLRDALSMYDESSTNACVEIDYQIKIIAQAEDDSFKDFGRQRHQLETQANQNRAKAGEAAIIRLAIDNMYQKVKKGLLSKFRRRDAEVFKLIDKFNFIKNQIWDMVEIEAQMNTMAQPTKTVTRTTTPTIKKVLTK